MLKLIGDGILAIFHKGDRLDACRAALSAEADRRRRIHEVNEPRRSESSPISLVRLGLHLGDVLFGNIGSDTRFDFTVVGPAVNEVNRIVAMCRSVDRTCLRRQISSPRFQALKGRDSYLWDASLSKVSGARKSCSRWIRIDRPRVVHVLERIAANLDNLALVSNDPQFDKSKPE